MDNAFSGSVTSEHESSGHADLFTVVVLEHTHLLGMSNDPELLFQKNRADVNNDGRIDIQGDHFTIFNTGVPDDAEGQELDFGRLISEGTFWVFDGDSVDALLTTNSG